MNIYERVKLLAQERKISIAQLERTLNLSNGSLSKWATAKPNSEPLEKVAGYFNVSTDYLLGRTTRKDPWPASTPEDDFSDVLTDDENENELLTAFRLESEDMTDEEKKKFNNSLKGMMKIAKGLLNDDSKWKE
jgi:transcriptional regulator with XRE-family HTH domain